MDFQGLVKFLRAHGYEVEVRQSRKHNAQGQPIRGKKGQYGFALVTGRNIRAGFCEPNEGHSYRSLDGQIAADHQACFDKWAKCPLILPFPENDEQAQKLLALLERLASKEGLEESRSYNYLDNNPYRY